jgi:DNA-directed RNA polymerase III subunit RPC6
MVYTLIDEARSDGIWSRTLKAKLKMHESVLKSCLKRLESKGYITDMKSVEHPNKKMYIRADLRPSDRATGGPWYTDNNLDEAFIADLEGVVFNFVKRKSAYSRETSAGGGGGTGGSKAPKKGVVSGKKRSAADISDEQQQGGANGGHAARAHQHHNRKEAFLPYPAGYSRYPTIREIAKFISDMGITNNTTLSETEVQQLVDVLVYDGLVEAVRIGPRKGYRVTRIAKQEPIPQFGRGEGDEEEAAAMRLGGGGPGGAAEPGINGLMEAPCGRCPVFELCEEGGPVSPSNCVYFSRWLGIE